MTDSKVMDMMMQSLDQQGTLSKVKAQIKAAVFKIIDQAAGKKNNVSSFFWENEKGKNLHKSNELLLLLEVVKEFLQFFDFDYTLSVLNCECNHKEYVKRDTLSGKLGLIKSELDSQQPLLQHIYQKFNPKASKQQLQTQKSWSEQPIKKEPPKVEAVKPGNQKMTPGQMKNQKNSKDKEDFQFEEIEEDLDDYTDIQSTLKKNPSANLMLTSSEEQLASMSQGLDITVDSNEIDQYDHVENIKFK